MYSAYNLYSWIHFFRISLLSTKLYHLELQHQRKCRAYIRRWRPDCHVLYFYHQTLIMFVQLVQRVGKTVREPWTKLRRIYTQTCNTLRTHHGVFPPSHFPTNFQFPTLQTKREVSFTPKIFIWYCSSLSYNAAALWVQSTHIYRQRSVWAEGDLERVECEIDWVCKTWSHLPSCSKNSLDTFESSKFANQAGKLY